MGDLPWALIATGMMIGVVIIALDLRLERRNCRFRMPVLAVAVGIYLPLEMGSAIFLGGLIAWLAAPRGQTQGMGGNGLLFASGLITGEALLGILIAVPIVLNEGVNPLRIGVISFRIADWTVTTLWAGPLVFAVVAVLLYSIARKRRRSSE